MAALMEEAAGELRSLIAKATAEDLSDGGRYFAETYDDLTRCRHEEIGEYQHATDGELIEWLWNRRNEIAGLYAAQITPPASTSTAIAAGEVDTIVRQRTPIVADYGEHFLVAHVSKDSTLVGIDHPCDAAWSDVMTAHVALSDRINERIAKQDGCPFKPATAAAPKAASEDGATGLREAAQAALAVLPQPLDERRAAALQHYKPRAALHDAKEAGE